MNGWKNTESEEFWAEEELENEGVCTEPRLGGHTWSRGCWAGRCFVRAFLKVHSKIRNYEKERENTVGQNEGKKQQEAEKTQCKE